MTNDTRMTTPAATTILALDLGKFKSVACVYDHASGAHQFETIGTSPAAVHDLLVQIAPARLVIEACSIAGWVADIARTLGIELEVANVNTEPWKWQRVKRKTDRDDALKLAKLSAMNQLPMVYVPEPAVRQHKALIKYRHALIDRRTGIKNTIRSLLDSQGLSWPARSRGWTIAAIKELSALSRPLHECDALNFWRGELHLELRMLEQVSALIAEADKKLDGVVAKDARMLKLKTIPGVGDRLPELCRYRCATARSLWARSGTGACGAICFIACGRASLRGGTCTARKSSITFQVTRNRRRFSTAR